MVEVIPELPLEGPVKEELSSVVDVRYVQKYFNQHFDLAVERLE